MLKKKPAINLNLLMAGKLLLFDIVSVIFIILQISYILI